jgi:hypothetical protein
MSDPYAGVFLNQPSAPGPTLRDDFSWGEKLDGVAAPWILHLLRQPSKPRQETATAGVVRLSF